MPMLRTIFNFPSRALPKIQVLGEQFRSGVVGVTAFKVPN